MAHASPVLDCDSAELRHDDDLEAALRQCADGCRDVDSFSPFQPRNGHPRDVESFGKIGLLQFALLSRPSDGLAEVRSGNRPGMIHISVIANLLGQ